MTFLNPCSSKASLIFVRIMSMAGTATVGWSDDQLYLSQFLYITCG